MAMIVLGLKHFQICTLSHYKQMKAVFIGSGNVASHLSLALQTSGLEFCQVYSHTIGNAQILAEKLHVPYTNKSSDIYKDADIYFYALKDDVLQQFIEKVNLPNGIHVHTAGSIPMIVFEGYAKNYGVFYPLQTFSKSKIVDFKLIPICIEASSLAIESVLLELANSVSKKNYLLSSEQRMQLHLSAVFASNFTNRMYAIAAEILEDAGMEFDIIKPLIEETCSKIRTLHPSKAQTGPALRHDEKIIQKHIELLSEKPEIQKLYKEISENI